MNFTSKEEYGLRAAMHLAANEPLWPVQSREIAAAEAIPEQFLEQVLAGLRRAGIVRSIRGAAGGYQLARSAAEITAGDVIRALSGPIAPVPCAEQDSQDQSGPDAGVVPDLWRRVQSAIVVVLDSTTISDLVEEKQRREQARGYMMYI